MNPKRVLALLSSLRLLPGMAWDAAALEAVAVIVGSMASDEKQVQWLASEMVSGRYEKWPGPAEMRRLFCERFRPKDGIVIASCSGGASGTYQFILREKQSWPPQIEAPEMRSLPSPASEDQKVDTAAMVGILAQTTAMPRERVESNSAFSRRMEEILTAPKDRAEVPYVAPITAARRAEIEAAIAKEVATRHKETKEA